MRKMRKKPANKNQEFVGRIHSKTLNASLQSVSYDNSNALLASVASGKQGYLAFKLNVEKNRIYQTKFNCDVLGASGTTYNDGTTEGDSASVFILANSEDLTNSSSRIYYGGRRGSSSSRSSFRGFSGGGGRSSGGGSSRRF